MASYKNRHLFVLVLTLGACGPTPLAPDAGPDDPPLDARGVPDARPVPDARTGGDDINRPDAAPPCESLLLTVRDFRANHPDFESFTGDEVFTGIVEPMLGPDRKPVYAAAGPTTHTTGPPEFEQWYRDTPGINQAVSVRIELEEVSTGLYVFDDSTFFPVDGEGFAETAIANDGLPHNFHFTTEINTSFVYRPGQTFTFAGDDDLWLFINDRLALDLGGLHQAVTGTVDMDAQAAELGIEPGQRYKMDIFHAERHTTASNFHIETSIDCFIVE